MDSTGELRVSFGMGSEIDPAPIAPEVFALPGARHLKGFKTPTSKCGKSRSLLVPAGGR